MRDYEHSLSSPQVAESHLTTRETWQSEIARRRDIGEAALSNFQTPLTAGNLELVDPAVVFVAAKYSVHAGTTQEEEEVIDRRTTAMQEAILQRADDPSSIDFRPMFINDPEVQAVIKSRDLSGPHGHLLEMWPHFRETYAQGVKNGIRLGYIPDSVEDRLEPALTKTSVRVADSAVLDACSVLGAGTDATMIAYYRTDLDEIGVRHDLHETVGGLSNALAREFTHKLSGGTFETDTQGDGIIATKRSRVGFSTEIQPDVGSRLFSTEAVARHIARGIMTGDFETLDPDKREDKDEALGGYYRSKVLAEFVDRSQGLIDVKTVTNAFFEDTGPDDDIRLRRKYVQEVRQAYGSGALLGMEVLMALASSIVDTDRRLEEVVLSRIHSPELDEQGRVTKRGYIDMQNLPDYSDLPELVS